MYRVLNAYFTFMLAWMILGFQSASAQNLTGPGTDNSWVNNFEASRSETLLEQGKLLLQQRDLFAAEKTFAEAIQIAKVNNGLYSNTQIPALEQQLSVLIAQEKWSLFDQQIAYLEWLYNSGSDLEELLGGMDKLSYWYMAAAAGISDTESAWYLIQAKNWNWRAVSLIERTRGPQDLSLTPWLYRLVLAHFYQASLIQRRDLNTYDYKSNSRQLANGWSLKKNGSLARSYNIGQELLQRIRSIYANSDSASPTLDAIMKIYMADWQMLYGNGRSALQYYQQAIASLIQNGTEISEINAYFRRPVIIPNPVLNLEWQIAESTGTEIIPQNISFTAWSSSFPGASAPASYNIINDDESVRPKASALLNLYSITPGASKSNQFSYGIADIELKALSPDDEQTLRRAQYELNNLQLRPVFIDGQPIGSNQVNIDYYFAEK